MNKAHYHSANASGEAQYPLSIETLDFIQRQIQELGTLAGALGDTYCLGWPEDGQASWIVIKGELMPFVEDEGHPPTRELSYIHIVEEHQGATIDGIHYPKLRTLRRAVLTDQAELTGSTRRMDSSGIPNLPSVLRLEDRMAVKIHSVSQLAQLGGFYLQGPYEMKNSVYPTPTGQATGDYRLVIEEVLDYTLQTGSPRRTRQTLYLPDGSTAQRYLGEGDSTWTFSEPKNDSVLGVLTCAFFGSNSSWSIRTRTGIFRDARIANWGETYSSDHEDSIKLVDVQRPSGVHFVISCEDDRNIRGYSVRLEGSTLVVRGASIPEVATRDNKRFTIVAVKAV